MIWMKKPESLDHVLISLFSCSGPVVRQKIVIHKTEYIYVIYYVEEMTKCLLQEKTVVSCIQRDKPAPGITWLVFFFIISPFSNSLVVCVRMRELGRGRGERDKWISWRLPRRRFETTDDDALLLFFRDGCVQWNDFTDDTVAGARRNQLGHLVHFSQTVFILQSFANSFWQR